MCKEGDKIPDNHECCIITVKSSGTQIFLTDYVKANRIPFENGVLEFHYLHTYTGPAPKDGWMENRRKRSGEDWSFDELIKEKTKNTLPHEVRKMKFSEMPEEIKKLFREFEPWAKFNILTFKELRGFNI